MTTAVLRPRWYVARTEPRAEFMAAKALARDGYEVFFPLVIKPHSEHDNTETPLFPGYIFLHFDSENGSWPSFLGTHRIAGWVKFGGEIPSLPDSEIAELRDHLESINQQGGLANPFKPGELVDVVAGNLQCLAEVVEGSKSPQGRVKVLLQFMGRQIPAQVSRENLRQTENSSNSTERPARGTRGGGRWIKGVQSRSQDNV
jgi:transcriptional antiterminator RfaH